jgi:hypothetical protein
MQLHRFIRIAAVSLGFAAIAAPVAVAQPMDNGPQPAAHQDLSGFYRPAAQHRTAPDIALRRSSAGTCGTDYSRNSVDGGYCATSPNVDLRSPDARDAARGVTPHSVAPVAATAPKADDTDWGKIGIIGGSALGALVLCALGFVLFTRRTPVPTR